MSTVLVDVDGPLATITLNRPAKLNAVDSALATDLADAVDHVGVLPEVRVVLVRGAGRSFCAGLDREMAARQEIPAWFFERTEQARLGLEAMDKISVADVHGYCLGGGVQLAIACDIRIAADDCSFALPAVSDGIIPGMAPIRLPRLIGLGPARRLMLTGEVIGTEEAFRLGLVDHVVPAADRAAAVEALIAGYLAAPRSATIALKRLLAQAFSPTVAEVAPTAAALFDECLAAPEHAEAGEAWRRRARA